MTQAQNQGHSVESRGGPIILVLAVSGIFELLPLRLRAFPTWATYVVALLLITPLLGAQLSQARPPWVRAERIAVFLFVGAMSISIVRVTFRLVGAIVYHTPEVPPLPLLESTAALWMLNVLLFTLVYWEMDRGGPGGRLFSGRQPDFNFAQSTSSKALGLDWRPEFVDYLFLAFTTSTAFGPADTLPITSRAKILMIFQASVSLVTIVVVGARAVGTLR